MKIVLDTDLGRDPDDALALLWLLSRSDVEVLAVTITPGHRDQIAFARFALAQAGRQGVPVGGHKTLSRGPTLTACHSRLLRHYGADPVGEPDGPPREILREAFERHSGAVLLTTGPLTNVAGFLETSDLRIERSVGMGGYRGSEEAPRVSPEFNFDTDRSSARRFLDSGRILRRFLVGRNVTHDERALYDEDLHSNLAEAGRNCRVLALMSELMSLRSSGKPKLLHDLLAAVLCLHPELAEWREGAPYRCGGWGWRDRPGSGIWIAAKVDYGGFKAKLSHR